eukprot:Nk52_evm1s2208 gene=Nk52_evmTU1s2208
MEEALRNLAKVAASEKLRRLRDECLNIIEDLQSADGKFSPLNDPRIVRRRMFKHFKLGLIQNIVKLNICALEGIQKLITQCVAPTEPSEFEDDTDFSVEVIQAVCNCFKGRDTPGELAKAVVKALVFIVTCSPVPVHGDSLLLCFETCMLIFLQSKNSSGRIAAKVALIQMTNDICQRLEVCKMETTRKQKWKKNRKANDDIEEKLNESVGSIADVGLAIGELKSTAGVSGWSSNPFGEEDSSDVDIDIDEFDRDNGNCSETGECESKGEECDGSLPSSPRKMVENRSLYRFNSLDSFVEEGVFTLLEKDVIIIFKYFCKLCSAPNTNSRSSVPHGTVAVEERQILIKTQSLHLILIVLDVLSPTLQHNESFVKLVRDYLCNAALMACAVPSKQIFKLCASIFCELLSTFKTCLLSDYPKLLEELFLKPLGSAMSSNDLFAEVLTHLSTMCSNGEYISLFCEQIDNERTCIRNIVFTLCKLLKSSNNARIKALCLDCVNNILKSIDSWYSNQLHDLHLFVTGYIEKREIFPISHTESIAEISACMSNVNMKNVTFLEAIRKVLPSLIKTADLRDLDVKIISFASVCAVAEVDEFQSADDIYYATYATIALNLNAHGYHKHDYVRKISKEDFVNDLVFNTSDNFRGGQVSCANEYFKGLYDTVVAVDILGIMGTANESASLSSSTCVMGYGLKELMAKKVPFHRQSVHRKGFPDRECDPPVYRGTQLAIVKIHDILEIFWRPIYVAISVAFENSSEPDISAYCLECFKRMIRLSSIIGLELALDSYVSGLASFSKTSLHNMEQKHWSALNCLISIGIEYGCYLEGNWSQILSCISHLEHQHALYTAEVNAGSNDFNRDPTHTFNYQSISLDVERLFQDSSNFSFQMLLSFCNELSSVAAEELNMKEPRFFCLRKLVDILCENMNRIHIEWRFMWNSIGNFFGSVGNHHSQSVTSVVIDSLHLIVSQYFERQEMPGFHFHEKMIKPYEMIIAVGSRRSDIKNRIVNCIDFMCEEHSQNLKSAWKSVFKVLTKCNKRKLRFSDEGLSPVFAVVEKILQKDESVFRDCVAHCVKCVVTFTKPSFGVESHNHAVRLLDMCLTRLTEVQPEHKWIHSHLQFATLVEGLTSESEILDDDAFGWIKLWHLCVNQIVLALPHAYHSIQTSLFSSLIGTLKSNFHLFRPSFSDHLFSQMLLPAFRDICDSREGKWQKNIRFASIILVDLFCDIFFDDISSDTLDSLLLQLSDNMLLNDEIVARSGTSCLRHLIQRNGKAFTEGIWAKTVRLLYDIFMETMPDSLYSKPALMSHNVRKCDGMTRLIQHVFVIEEEGMNEVCFPVMDFKKGLRKKCSSYAPRDDSELGLTVFEDFYNDVCVKLVVQLVLIQIADYVLADDDKVARVSETNFHILMQALKKSYAFAHNFNKDVEIRKLLQRKIGTKQLPNLLRQETTCASTYLRVLFSVYSMSSRSDLQNVYEGEIEDICAHVCSTFVSTLEGELHENAVWRPVMMTLLNATLALDKDHFHGILFSIFPLVAELIMIEDKEVRLLVKRFVKKSVEFRELLPRDGWKYGHEITAEIENVMNEGSLDGSELSVKLEGRHEIEMEQCNTVQESLTAFANFNNENVSKESAPPCSPQMSGTTYTEMCFSPVMDDNFEDDEPKTSTKRKGQETSVESLRPVHIDSGKP